MTNELVDIYNFQHIDGRATHVLPGEMVTKPKSIAYLMIPKSCAELVACCHVK